MARKRRIQPSLDGFGSSSFDDDDDDDDLDDELDEGLDDVEDFDSFDVAAVLEDDDDDDAGGGPDPSLTVVRVDKWLWAARMFKTRNIASEACNENQVKVNEVVAKASKMVRPVDEVVAITAGGKRRLKVVALAEKRGPASLAQQLYVDDTHPEWAEPRKAWDSGSSDYDGGIIQDKKGRKRDRRAARKLKRR